MGDRGRFCTATMATVTPSGDGVRVRMTAAGHPQGVLLTRDGKASLVGGSGSLLGVFEDLSLSDDALHLAPGDCLVLYTDGVTERRDGGRMFGEEGLLAVCAAAAGAGAQDVAGMVEQAVRDFGGEASRDDLAVLVVRATA